MTELAQVLRRLLPVDDPNALVDASTGDDAAVYRIDDHRAIVVTVDFFTPIVDDPFEFGRIGATNALSDLYAMGAKPLFALNLVGFPRRLLAEGILDEIIAGGAAVCRAAGIPVLGGHSIDDAEPKFGMVAVGEVNPERMTTNAGARPRDRLVLTKPLGSGVVATAIKADAAAPEVIEHATRVMTTLNRAAAEAASALGVRAATDVTGYGLLGHLRAMLRASHVSAVIDSSLVPLMPGALQLVADGHVPGGSKRNAEDVASDVTWDDEIPREVRTLLADAQTSGGLLIAVAADRTAALLDALHATDTPVAAVIGEITEGKAGRIRVL
jgi:selenide, water dikinase